jgi:hypothetical protein
MLSQFGLSLIMPVLMCMFACYLLVSKLSVGAWVFIPGLILGIGASCMTAFKFYQSVTGKQKKNPRSKGIGFNRHL